VSNTNSNTGAAQALTVTIETLFPTVFGSEWKTMSESDAIEFRNLLEAFVAGASMLREKFDADVWAEHATGKFTNIKSVRAPRTGDKPGRKPAEVTAASLLAKRLKK
jgi:hypothetical protein